MNRAPLPSEMLHCTDMTVLERQKEIHMKWKQQQQEGCFGNMVMRGGGGGFQGFEDGCLGEVVTRSVVKPDPGMVVDNINHGSNNGWCDMVSFGGGTSSVGIMSNNNGGINNAGCGFGMNFGISRTSSCPPGAMEIVGMSSKARDHQLQQQQPLLSETVITTSGVVGRESVKKRKFDKVQTNNSKVVAEQEEEREKKIKVCAEDGESKITEKQSGNKKSNNNNKENSCETSKDNSKVTEVQKPDYIHVRARRGQATDSHSLAERVRREKISERMKYLQDLVPGCNKITGKAGMLDEIINYVQSLQRQVEFLSMKLAAVNPRLDFNIDNLFAKEALSAYATNFPTIGMSSDMTNPTYLEYNPIQQQLATCGLDIGVNSPEMALRRTISAPVSLPDTFLDSSCFTQIQASSTWDADLQSLYNVAFDQARPTSYPSQQFTGSIEACNMKMEM